MTRPTIRARPAVTPCHDCTAPAEPGHVYCARHRTGSRARNRATRASLRAAGLCVECRQPSPASRRCRACLDQINARNQTVRPVTVMWRGIVRPNEPLAPSELTGGAYVRLLVPEPVALAVAVVAKRRGVTQAEAFAIVMAL